jgi:hypothetical protein
VHGLECHRFGTGSNKNGILNLRMPFNFDIYVPELNPDHIGGSGATVGFLHVEGDSISFRKGFEPLSLNRRKMNEDVALTFFLFDEAKSLFVTKPFYNTVCHFCSLLKKVNVSCSRPFDPTAERHTVDGTTTIRSS